MIRSEAFLVSFKDLQGQVRSEVVYLSGSPVEAALLLTNLFTGDLVAWSHLSQQPPQEGCYSTRVAYTVEGQNEAAAFTHTEPILTSEDVRGIEENIQAALKIGPICITACEPA